MGNDFSHKRDYIKLKGFCTTSELITSTKRSVTEKNANYFTTGDQYSEYRNDSIIKLINNLINKYINEVNILHLKKWTINK